MAPPTMDVSSSPTVGQQGDLQNFLALLRRQRWPILICAIATAAVSLFFSLIASEKFAATAQVLYTDPGVSAGSIGSGDPERAIDTFVRLATTDDVLRQLVGTMGITSTDEVRAATAVSGIPTANLITVHATASTAQAAADLANGIAQSMIKWREDNRNSQLTARITFLQQQIRKLAGRTSPSEVAATSDLRTQLAESQAQLSVPNPELTLVSPARPPDEPFSPRPIRNGLLGLLAGLILGFCAGALRDRLDRRLRTSEEIEDVYPWPLLGVVPLAHQRRGVRSGLVDFTETSSLADAYRGIRTNLTLVGLDQPERKIIALSSAMPGEGKSAAVANLAAALAASGKRVLAISADLHAPALHEYFSADGHSRPGLIEILAKESRPEAAATKVALPATEGSANDGSLSMIGNARIFSDPAVLFESAAMASFLEWARQRYDLILIDAPPLLYTAEASLLGRSADGLVLVGRVDHLTRHEASRATRLLGTVQLRPLGIIVNGVREVGVEYGYRKQASKPRAAAPPPPVNSKPAPANDSGATDKKPVPATRRRQARRPT